MSETTQELPVTESQLAQAQQQHAAAESWLRAAPDAHPERAAYVDKKIAAHAIIRRAAEQARPQPAPPTMSPAERVATIAARRATHAALQAEQAGSEMNTALLDVAIEQSTAVHAGDRVSGTYTEADLRGATREAGMTDEGHALYLAGLDRLGVSSGVERMQLTFALRDSTPEPEETLTAEEVSARCDEWWGSDADANLVHAERVWTKLTQAERLALNPFRGSRPFMEQMVKLGKRLAGAR